MVPFVGQPFDAHITGITSFGLFVGLENGIEGLIHISLLTDDTYEFDENTYTMRGLFGGHVYRLGDPLEVTLANVNLEKCEIDFVPGRVESLEDLQKILAASAERRHHRSGSRERKQPSWQESKDAKYGSGKKKKKGKKDKKEKKTSTAKKNGHKGKKKSHKGGRAGKK